MIELLLLMVKCENSKIPLFSDSIECWKGLHLLYAFLSILFSLIFYAFVIILNVFLFNPLHDKHVSTKVDTTADILLLIFKIINVLRYIFIANDWFSILIIFLLGLLNLKIALEKPTYNNYFLDCGISIRNSCILWTYSVLLLSKIAENTNFNGQSFLLLFGFPLIIGVSLIYYKKKFQNFNISNSNFNDEKEVLLKINYLKSLIDSFLSKNKNSKSNKTNGISHDEIFLKGYVLLHEETCVNEDCPLKKYLACGNDFNIQKMSLLHYMNILLNEGMKKFPNSKIFVMSFVQFNYEKKYNLNSAKSLLAKLEKTQNSLTEEFIIFCIKQNLNNTNRTNKNNSNDDEMTRIEDTAEHKFKRCKYFKC